jgi:hypothetical protein
MAGSQGGLSRSHCGSPYRVPPRAPLPPPRAWRVSARAFPSQTASPSTTHAATCPATCLSSHRAHQPTHLLSDAVVRPVTEHKEVGRILDVLLTLGAEPIRVELLCVGVALRGSEVGGSSRVVRGGGQAGRGEQSAPNAAGSTLAPAPICFYPPKPSMPLPKSCSTRPPPPPPPPPRPTVLAIWLLYIHPLTCKLALTSEGMMRVPFGAVYVSVSLKGACARCGSEWGAPGRRRRRVGRAPSGAATQ